MAALFPGEDGLQLLAPVSTLEVFSTLTYSLKAYTAPLLTQEIVIEFVPSSS